MEIQGWIYYNHAAIPNTSPHEEVNKAPIEDKSIWGIDGKKPLMARWTSDFDCTEETNWWYVIKDTSFDLASLKAKRRYEVNKGLKNFEVKQIEPLQYQEELYQVQVDAFSAYPAKYRPHVEKEKFFESLEKWQEKYLPMGAFSIQTGELVGYALLSLKDERCIEFVVLKTKPAHEKFAVNAALVAGVLEQIKEFLANGGYICDGGRSINHETAFQDYLEKYFGFRKAYCKLHIQYRPAIKPIIRLLYPFRNCLKSLDKIGPVHQINSVLRMEEIVRSGGKK